MVDLQQLDLSGLPDKTKKPKLDLAGLPDKQKKQTPVVATEVPVTPPASSRTASDIDLRKIRQLDFSGVKPSERDIPDDEFLTGKEPTILDRLATGSMRIGGGIAGAILGGIAGTEVPIVGNIIGGIAGGAAGSAAGDERAQAYEIKHGLRKKYSLAQTAIEGVTGAIPGGKFVKGGKVLAQAGREAVRGAAITGAASIAQSELERGELPAFKDLATATVIGGLLGGATGGVIQKVQNRGGRTAPAGATAPVPGKLDDIPMTPVPDGEAPIAGVSYVTLNGKKFKIEPMASHAPSAPIETPITPMKPVASHETSVAAEASAPSVKSESVQRSSGADNIGVKPGTQAIQAEVPVGFVKNPQEIELVHGTTSSDAVESIMAEGKFRPGKRSYDYSDGGPDAVFFGAKGSDWFAEEGIGRGVPYGHQVEARFKPDAKVLEINSWKELDAAAKRAGFSDAADLVKRMSIDGLIDGNELPAGEVGSLGSARDAVNRFRKANGNVDAIRLGAIGDDMPEELFGIGSITGNQTIVWNHDVVQPVSGSQKFSPRTTVQSQYLDIKAESALKRGDNVVLVSDGGKRRIQIAGVDSESGEMFDIDGRVVDRVDGDTIEVTTTPKSGSRRGPVVAEKLDDVPTLKPGEEPVRTSRVLPNEEDVDMAEFGTLGRPQEIPPADAPVPKRFLDNPRAVREQVRRIIAELDAVQFEKGTVLSGDDLDANFIESGFTERPGSREAFQANALFPNLMKMNPNAPIFHELASARPRVDANGKQISAGGGRRTGRQIRNAGMRYIEGQGRPTQITEDIVRLARKIARGDLKFRDWKLPEDAGKVAEDFASSRPDADAVRIYETEFPEAFASTEQLTGEPTPNISAPMPGSPIGAGSGGRGGAGGGGRPPGGGDPDFIPPTGGEGEGPVTRTAPGKMSEEQQQRGIQLLGFDKAVRPALKGMLEATEGFEVHRRGVQSFSEHTKVLADQIAVDIEQTLPRGRALNAEETVAYANRLAEATERVTSLGKRVQDGTASAEETLQLAAAVQEQYVLQKSLWGSVSETGRALNAWRLMMNILETGDTKFMKWAVKQGIGDDMEQLAEKLAEIGGDPAARFKWLQSEVNAKMSKMDMLKAYYYGNLLSGVATHERNFLSNSANLLFSMGADVATGRAGHAAASLKGVASALFKRSPQYGGTALGLPKAIQTFVDEIRYGFNPANLDANGVMAGAGRIAAELPGGVKNPWNATRRALDAADGFFRALTLEGEKYRFAYDIAKNSPDQDFAKTMAKAYANIPPDKMREIEAVVSKGVFQEEPGKIGKAIMGLQKSLGPAGWVVMPFIRIAANITQQGIEVTPAGFFTKAAKQQGRVGELARARAAAGSMLLLPIVGYAAAGRITGNGPSDPGERASWLASGKRPNSIWNPATNSWVSYQAWQPMAFPMSVVANMIESVHDMKAKAQKRAGSEDIELSVYPELVGQALLRTMGSVLNQSFLSGVSSLMDAMNQPERSVGKVVGTLATGFMPLSGATRTAAQVVDRTQRAPEGVVEAAQGVIPFASKGIEPLIDRFGEPVDSQGNPLTRGFYQSSASKDEALAKVLDAAGVFPQRPNANLTGVDGKPVKLTRPEETVLMMARGRARRIAYESVVANPAFAKWSPEQREAALESTARTQVGAVTGIARGLKASGQPLSLQKLLPQAQIQK